MSGFLWLECLLCLQGSGALGIFLKAATWLPESEKDLVDDIRRWCIVWPFTLKAFIHDQAFLDPEISQLLFPEELALMDGSPKKRQARGDMTFNDTFTQDSGRGFPRCSDTF